MLSRGKMGEDGKREKIKRGSLLLGKREGVGKLGMGMISVCKNWIILPTAFRRHTHGLEQIAPEVL